MCLVNLFNSLQFSIFNFTLTYLKSFTVVSVIQALKSFMYSLEVIIRIVNISCSINFLVVGEMTGCNTF